MLYLTPSTSFAQGEHFHHNPRATAHPASFTGRWEAGMATFTSCAESPTGAHIVRAVLAGLARELGMGSYHVKPLFALDVAATRRTARPSRPSQRIEESEDGYEKPHAEEWS